MKTITFNLYKFTELQPGIQLQIIKNNTLLYKEKYFEMIESNFTNVGVDLKIKDFTIVKFEPFIDIIDIAGHILMYEDLSPGESSDFFKNVPRSMYIFFNHSLFVVSNCMVMYPSISW